MTGASGLTLEAVVTAREFMQIARLSENTAYARLRPGGDLHHLVLAMGGRNLRLSGFRVVRWLEGEEGAEALQHETP